MGSKAIVVLSGGQDSTTCLWWAKSTFSDVRALTFDYGQRHSIEIDSARKIAGMAQVPINIVNVPEILKGASPLVSDTELKQHTNDFIPKGIAETFVPCRNQLFLTLAANYAFNEKAYNLVTGTCLEDYESYPDCRDDFIKSLEQALNLGTFTERPLKIHTPLVKLTKAETCVMAALNGAYHALAWSHTAYDGKFPPKGKDQASILRARGFREAGLPDPLVIRAWLYDEMKLPTSANYKLVDKDLKPKREADSNIDGVLKVILNHILHEWSDERRRAMA